MKKRIRSTGGHADAVRSIALVAVIVMAMAALAACSAPLEAEIPPVGKTLAEETPDAPADALPDVFTNTARADHEVLAALYGHFRGVRHEADWFDKAAADGTRIAVYACRPFENGVLAAADFYHGGEMTADLFYIESGAVKHFTMGSDVWSMNYTRFMGSTIVYGKSFAWDNGIQATSHADARFFNGDAESVNLIGHDKDDGNTPGFIFVSDGSTWLESLRIYDGDKLVTDDGNYQFVVTAPFGYAGRLGIWDRTHFNPMYDIASRQRRVNDAADTEGLVSAAWGDGVCGAGPSYKDQYTQIADIWRSNNLRYDALSVPPTAGLAIRGLDTAEVVGAYWAETALDDGTEAGMAACLGGDIMADGIPTGQTEFTLTAPDRAGRYALIFETEAAYFAIMVIVQE